MDARDHDHAAAAPKPLAHFSPWLEQRDCRTCAHSLGMDGPHLWCEQHRIVVVMPCGAWERGAGCD